MVPDTAEVLESAKQREHEQIAGLVHELLGVLDGADTHVDQEAVLSAWHAELRHRLTEIERGDVELVDGEESLALARAELAARRR